MTATDLISQVLALCRVCDVEIGLKTIMPNRMLKKTASRGGVAWLVPRAHGTPTMKGMEPDDLLCSRNARPQNDGEGAARCPSCSQNAHGESVLVRCAQ